MFDHQYTPFTLIYPPWKSACYVETHESWGTLGVRRKQGFTNFLRYISDRTTNPELETDHTQKSPQIHLRQHSQILSSVSSEVPDTENHGKVVYKRRSAGIHHGSPCNTNGCDKMGYTSNLGIEKGSPGKWMKMMTNHEIWGNLPWFSPMFPSIFGQSPREKETMWHFKGTVWPVPLGFHGLVGSWGKEKSKGLDATRPDYVNTGGTGSTDWMGIANPYKDRKVGS